MTTPTGLPVWTYWEGPLPDWIAECRETIRRHVPQARFLGPGHVPGLAESGLLPDLDRLYVAHRADVIRAHLLATYGGLWIDLDCLVMRPLEPILDLLGDADFVGHLERQGRISNAFIASRPGGRIASMYLARVVEILRSGAPIEWLTLGAAALMEVLGRTDATWRQLPTEMIQPICWSEPGRFFAAGSPQEHAARFDPAAACYMLSNNSVHAWLERHPGDDLRAPGTFFRFLADRSLGIGDKPAAFGRERDASFSPGVGHLPIALDSVARLGAQRVLVAATGGERWRPLIGDVARRRPGGAMAAPPTVDLVQLVSPAGTPAAPTPLGAPTALLEAREDRWDLVILELSTEDGGEDDRRRLVAAALDAAPYVVVSIAPGPRAEGDPGAPPPEVDLLELDPIRFATWREPGGAAAVALVSLVDPHGLRRRLVPDGFGRAPAGASIPDGFSASGPGSSFAQTGTLRRDLPKLLKDLGVHTLLDAPCGDLAWMQHVLPSIGRYVGIDVVPGLIARNRQRHERPGVSFAVRDLRTDALPRADAILMRDFLVHLSYADAFDALFNAARSGARYLLTTTFAGRGGNHDISSGDWRPLDLEAPPFSFPPPRRLLLEGCTEGGGQYADKSLAVWHFGDLFPAASDPTEPK